MTVFSGNIDHPTQKDARILTPLVEAFTRPGQLVLDPFAGSGSTLLAAAVTGRCYLGIELERQYCDLARNRLARVERRDAVQMSPRAVDRDSRVDSQSVAARTWSDRPCFGQGLTIASMTVSPFDRRSNGAGGVTGWAASHPQRNVFFRGVDAAFPFSSQGRFSVPHDMPI